MGFFYPGSTGHRASHLQHPIPWGREGCWGSASFLLQSQWFSADRESCVLGTFVLAATIFQGEMQIWMRAEDKFWSLRVAVVSPSHGWEILPSEQGNLGVSRQDVLLTAVHLISREDNRGYALL